MEHFNALKKLIVAPALIIALTAGSAMARPGHHSGDHVHHGAQISQSEAARDAAGQGADTTTTVTGKIVNLIANLSPLDATQDMGSPQEFQAVPGKGVAPNTDLSQPEATQSSEGPVFDKVEKSSVSQKASGDYYLDGEAHFQSAHTANDTGPIDANARVGTVDGSIEQNAEQSVQDISGGQYINAFGKAVGGVLKFKQWQDNPTKPPIGRNTADAATL
ncbi:MAG: hypothetical protein AAFX90_16350 [Pseudomonadota bacterium]